MFGNLVYLLIFSSIFDHLSTGTFIPVIFSLYYKLFIFWFCFVGRIFNVFDKEVFFCFLSVTFFQGLWMPLGILFSYGKFVMKLSLSKKKSYLYSFGDDHHWWTFYLQLQNLPGLWMWISFCLWPKYSMSFLTLYQNVTMI